MTTTPTQLTDEERATLLAAFDVAGTPVGHVLAAVESILAARGSNTDNGLRAAVLEAVRPTDSPMGTRMVLGSRDGSFVVDRVLAALDAAPAPTNKDCRCQIVGSTRDPYEPHIPAQAEWEQADDCPVHPLAAPAPTDNQHNNTLELLAADWRLLRHHHPVGAYHPVGQLDGDCSCGRGAWPCDAVFRAVVDGPTTPTQPPAASEGETNP